MSKHEEEYFALKEKYESEGYVFNDVEELDKEGNPTGHRIFSIIKDGHTGWAHMYRPDMVADFTGSVHMYLLYTMRRGVKKIQDCIEGGK